MNPFLLAAALLALAVCLTHLILGGREIARPLLDAPDFRNLPRYTLYYCWHLVTITFVGLALAFLFAAQPGGSRALAWFATIGAALFAALCVAINLRFNRRFWHHPQWALFLPVAACGAAGLL
jgi:hypothetical protein